jgi:small subunit ribosomal protein S7
MVTRFINKLMVSGKKSTAESIFYDALGIVETRAKRPGLEMFEQAINNVTPILEVKPRRVGGATYQVPVEVPSDRRLSLAFRWLIQSARKRPGKSMAEKLASELMDAANNTGATVKRREDTHKMAEANRAFAHYRW